MTTMAVNHKKIPRTYNLGLLYLIFGEIAELYSFVMKGSQCVCFLV